MARFEILTGFLALFFFGVSAEAQVIQPGDTIVVCGNSDVFLASAKAIGKKGPSANFQKHLVHLDITDKYVAIEEKFNATQFRVCIDDTQYLMSVGNPKTKKSMVSDGILYYVHKSFVDSLKAHYLEQPFYKSNGESIQYSDVNIGPKIEVIQKDWADVIYSGARPSILTYDPGQLSADGHTTNYLREFHDEFGTRSEADLIAERDARWAPSVVDSMRAKYVGDTLVLGKNLFEIKDSIDFRRRNSRTIPTETLKLCTAYSKVVIDDLYLEVARERDGIPQHMEYRMIIRPIDQERMDLPTICIDDVNYPQLFLSSQEYGAYLEKQRLLEEKRKEYIALSEQEWLEQQRALNEREMQFLEIYTKVYGEETGLDIWWGRIKFGFTEDMCKNAYRNSGMYRIKEHVSTPLGDAKQIHYLQRQIILYFIEDRLIGVTIYGNTTWDNVF